MTENRPMTKTITGALAWAACVRVAAPADRVVLVLLVHYARRAPWLASPTVVGLAQEGRMSRIEVAVALRRLIGAGLVVIEPACGRGRMKSYRVNVGAHPPKPANAPATTSPLRAGALGRVEQAGRCPFAQGLATSTSTATRRRAP